MLRPLSSLGGSGVNISGSVCACGWRRNEKLMVERNPVIQKEGTDEAGDKARGPSTLGQLKKKK